MQVLFFSMQLFYPGKYKLSLSIRSGLNIGRYKILKDSDRIEVFPMISISTFYLLELQQL